MTKKQEKQGIEVLTIDPNNLKNLRSLLDLLARISREKTDFRIIYHNGEKTDGRTREHNAHIIADFQDIFVGYDHQIISTKEGNYMYFRRRQNENI